MLWGLWKSMSLLFQLRFSWSLINKTKHLFKRSLAICELPILDFDNFLLGCLFFKIIGKRKWFVDYLSLLCFSAVLLWLVWMNILLYLSCLGIIRNLFSSFWKNFRHHFFKYRLSPILFVLFWNSHLTRDSHCLILPLIALKLLSSVINTISWLTQQSFPTPFSLAGFLLNRLKMSHAHFLKFHCG